MDTDGTSTTMNENLTPNGRRPDEISGSNGASSNGNDAMRPPMMIQNNSAPFSTVSLPPSSNVSNTIRHPTILPMVSSSNLLPQRPQQQILVQAPPQQPRFVAVNMPHVPRQILRPSIPTTPIGASTLPLVPSDQNQNRSSHEQIKTEKEKCLQFLKSIMRMVESRANGQELSKQVADIINDLLIGRMSPQNFTEKLPSILNSRPQPHLLVFLEGILPDVRKSYQAGEFTLESLKSHAAAAPSNVSIPGGPSVNSIAASLSISSIAAAAPSISSISAAPSSNYIAAASVRSVVPIATAPSTGSVRSLAPNVIDVRQGNAVKIPALQKELADLKDKYIETLESNAQLANQLREAERQAHGKETQLQEMAKEKNELMSQLEAWQMRCQELEQRLAPVVQNEEDDDGPMAKMSTNGVSSTMMNKNLAPKRETNEISTSNGTNGNFKNIMRPVIIQNNSGPINRNQTIIRTNQGQMGKYFLVSSTPTAVQGIQISTGNLPAGMVIGNISNGQGTFSSTSVPSDPLPSSNTIFIRHPTPPPSMVSSSTPGLRTLLPQRPQKPQQISNQPSPPVQFVATNNSPIVIGQSTKNTIESSSSPDRSDQRNQDQSGDKEKCLQFLKSIMRMVESRANGQELSRQVADIIDDLLIGRISPENFTEKIPSILNSRPQPHLLVFLETIIPEVRKSYEAGEFTLESLKGTPSIKLEPPTPEPNLNPILVSGTSASPSPSPSKQQQPSIYRQQVQPRFVTSSPPPSAQPRLVKNIAPYLITKSIRPQLPPPVPPPSRSSIMQIVDEVVGGSAGGSPMEHSALSFSPAVEMVPPPIVEIDLEAPAVDEGIAGMVPPATTIKSPAKTATNRSKARPSKKPESMQFQFEDFQKGEPEDEFNDLPTMGGINLVEEARASMNPAMELFAVESQSCGQDDDFLFENPLAAKIRAISEKYGLNGPVQSEVLNLVSKAAQERLKQLVEKLAVIAEHRMEPLRNNPFYEEVSDVRSQLRFVENLSEREREAREREMVLKMANRKSGDSDRSKDRTKEVQTAEQLAIRARDANKAVQMALSSSSKKRPASSITSIDPSSNSTNRFSAESSFALTSRPRYKRVQFRDLQLLLGRELGSKQSQIYYRSFYKK